MAPDLGFGVGGGGVGGGGGGVGKLIALVFPTAMKDPQAVLLKVFRISKISDRLGFECY
jgi:hypothetical protein